MTRRAALLACLLLLAAVAAAVALAKPPHKTGPAPRNAPRPGSGADGMRGASSPYWRLERRYRVQQHRMGLLGAEVRRLRTLQRQRDAAKKRLRTLQAASVGVEAHAVVDGLLCIHGGEASWDDVGSPYWGGLQMDAMFQRNYAPARLLALGTADHWTPLEQLAVGLIGWSLQGGYAPWPSTSRACGLR